MSSSTSWFRWAALSAVFAALTAIFAKIGIEGVDSDLATLVRTAIIIVVLSAFVWFAGKWSNPLALSSKTWLFLGLSGLATGASWVCYFRALQGGEASKVAPADKFSLVLGASLLSRSWANGRAFENGPGSQWSRRGCWFWPSSARPITRCAAQRWLSNAMFRMHPDPY